MQSAFDSPDSHAVVWASLSWEDGAQLYLLSVQEPGLACSLSAGSGIFVSWLWEAFLDLGCVLCWRLVGVSPRTGRCWKTAFEDSLKDIAQLGFLSRQHICGASALSRASRRQPSI